MDGQELANYTTGSNSLVWYVQGLNREIKLNHFATLSFDEASGNTSPANGYSTDPFVISINNPTTSLLPDPEYYSYDHLGNAHVVYKMNYNSSGALINPTIQYAADYYAFGKVVREYINSGLSSEKFKFTGKERDSETGLDYFGARYYSSEVGRFTGVDPKSEKYVSWNGYNYVKDNPIRLVDPDGMAAIPTDDYYFNKQGEIVMHVYNRHPDRFFVQNTNNNLCGSNCNIFNETKQFSQISMNSDIGLTARTVYAEMRSGDINAKSLVAESIINRLDLRKGSAENPNGTILGIINKNYKVTNENNNANPTFENPENFYNQNKFEKSSWLSSLSASIKAINGFEIGKGIIFYNSASKTWYDNREGYEKINLDFKHKGIEGTWKLEDKE